MDTFVVRVWRPVGEGPGDDPATASVQEMRGIVRHVGSGTESPFEGGDELVHLLGRPADPMGGRGRPPAAAGDDAGGQLGGT
jgi:hypothetical protein